MTGKERPKSAPVKSSFQKTKPEDTVIILFKMDGCGHCTTFEPIFNEFSKKYTDNIDTAILELYAHRPHIISFEKSVAKPVKGFPHIVKRKKHGGSLHDEVFQGNRTVEGLKAFAKIT